MTDYQKFKEECSSEINNQGKDLALKKITNEWISRASDHKYSYHFDWLGVPIIQHPQDMLGVQQLIWSTKPDLIIETGVARGGSLIFYASLLEMIACCGGNKDSMVLGIDIDIREHNRKVIVDHAMSKRIQLLEGSSTSDDVYNSVLNISKKFKNIMICLDSNHTHDHVLQELKLYAPLVKAGGYCIVFDTIIEDMPENWGPSRPWGKANNPKTAVFEYLKILENSEVKANDGGRLSYRIDKNIENQLLITVAPDGFLQRL